MKKLLLVSLLLMSATTFAEGYTTVRLSGGFNTDYKESGDSEGLDINVENSIGLGLEYLYPINNHLDLGIGIGIESLAKQTGSLNGNFYWINSGVKFHKNIEASVDPSITIPVYVTGKFTFNPTGKLKIYTKADLGYAYNKDTEFDYKETHTYLNGNSNTYRLNESVKYDNGLYAGIGLGAEYNNFTLDVMYKLNKMEGKIFGEKFKSDYTRTAVTVGYKFN